MSVNGRSFRLNGTSAQQLNAHMLSVSAMHLNAPKCLIEHSHCAHANLLGKEGVKLPEALSSQGLARRRWGA
jgi:hypothetical protein